MATLRTLGNGDRGYFLDIACVPDSTFKTELDALIGWHHSGRKAGHADLRRQLRSDLGCRGRHPGRRGPKLG